MPTFWEKEMDRIEKLEKLEMSIEFHFRRTRSLAYRQSTGTRYNRQEINDDRLPELNRVSDLSKIVVRSLFTVASHRCWRLCNT